LAEIFVCKSAELPEAGVRLANVNGVEIGFYRHEKRVFAYRNICPHQGGPVCEGIRIPKVNIELLPDGAFGRHVFDHNEMHIVCPWHGYEFKLETGESAGDPKVRLKRYPVTEKDGSIYVDI